ncbi:hypothetical protein MVES1_000372 [Malassezia vespertilionis]|uniref:uncharacterized protein n=1 Tax=Malassezia vespertilionis TaxID=2020962 RepID=UPI0024B11402|nr:uncharacterized protein MVES1_000372 [Malassezia vespertilionis]WFD05047.1 hypothetical protein MVES1_000372 [Malassezia vespertilionis]
MIRAPRLLGSVVRRDTARSIATSHASSYVKDLHTDPSHEPPTLEAVDLLAPAHAAARKRAEDPSIWPTTFRSLSDAFTRPQLYQLAKQAGLRDVRSASAKPALVRAFLEQRFQLRDPNAAMQDEATFLPLNLAEVFLIARHSPAFIQAAKHADANATVEKRDERFGVSITGTRDATARMQAWLNDFCAQIRIVHVPLACPVPADLISSMSRRSGCHMHAEDLTAVLTFTDAHTAHTAQILLEQYAAGQKVHTLWSNAQHDADVTALPFSVSTAHTLAEEYMLHTDPYIRWMDGTSVDAPHALTAGDATIAALDAAAASLQAVIPPVFVDGEWQHQLRAHFGHLVYPCTNQAPKLEPGTVCSANAIVQWPNPLFLASDPPSCIADAPQFGTDFWQAEQTVREITRLRYRSQTLQGTANLLLTWSADELDVHWEVAENAYVSQPAASIDACIAAVRTVPVQKERLHDTALAPYMEKRERSFLSESRGLAVDQPDPPLTIEMRGTAKDLAQLALYATERIVQIVTPYTDAKGTVQFFLLQENIQRDAMPLFSRSASIQWVQWPSEHHYRALLKQLSHSQYPALGRAS